ncbi:hypothetical protein LshimejAT787_1201690 [Lyophyllum shimeji]|uniref:N-acetyltransferase domain-containing protein n=1 Tax=Lyophyllum shimeji TaxID=47721 RepID=A0A9P3PTS4_LYOSH|nr:hypothetical protein LshimejAT787_1201690 [Lyophyllum shimeji]
MNDTERTCREEEAEAKGKCSTMTIRYYRHPDDLALIRQLFVEATTQGRGSPIVEGMSSYAPHSRLAFAAAALGITLTALAPSRRISGASRIAPTTVSHLGMFLCLASIVLWIYVCYHRRRIGRAFDVFLDEGLKGELGDVVKSFDLRIMPGGRCVPTGPSAFWVAEEKGEIIGIVGLNKNINPDPGVAEVRRLAVSSNHRGKRVAERLMDAVLDHARMHELRALEFTTSDYNTSARRFYTRMGYEIIKTKDWEGLSLTMMRQELDQDCWQ